MAKFLNEEQLIDALADMFEEAEDFMYVISPYIKLDKWLRKQFNNCEADEIIVVYGKDYMQKNSYNFLTDFEDIELYFHEDLHAKIYISENNAIITSMNLYDYSMDNNIECGILLSSNETAYDDALEFVEDLIDDSDFIA